MTLQAIAPDDRIGDQRVRGHDTTQQEGGRRCVTKHGDGHDIRQDEGHEAREQTEDHKRTGLFLHTLHIHLQTCQEHDIIESHPPEQFEGVVTFQDIEAILADDHTRQHHPDDMRNAQFTHHDRRNKDNHQHHKEDQCGVCDREIL